MLRGWAGRTGGFESSMNDDRFERVKVGQPKCNAVTNLEFQAPVHYYLIFGVCVNGMG